jgi:hypothetical protein
MSYLAMGLAFAAVGFVAANSLLSLLTALLWRALRPSRPRAGSLFLLRMLPAVGSSSFVLGWVLPAFRAFEPRANFERPGPAIAAVAVLAAALVVAGIYRTLVSWLYTRRLERKWTAGAVESQSLGRSAAYTVPSELPFAALIGVVRPRLFVSERFFDALTVGERRAVLDHEEAHRRSLDNLKRVAMTLAPDWLAFSAVGRDIERAWTIAAEREADDHAAGLGPARSLDLAGALLKAARATPISRALASSFCGEASIAHRIERLLDEPPARRAPAFPVALRWASVAALLGTASVLWEPVLRACYTVTESAIRLLS